MRISIDVRYLQRQGVGVAGYLRGLIDDVSRCHDLLLITSQESHACQLRDEYPSLTVEAVLDQREVSWEQVRLPRYLREARPDVHIAPASRGLPLRPVPPRLVLVVHDLIPLRFPRSHFREPFGTGRYLLGTAVSLGRAAMVIAASHSTAQDVGWFFGRRILVRYPGLPSVPRLLPPVTADLPGEFFVYNGGASERKNVALLIKAHSRYIEAGGRTSLVLVGRGYERYRAELDSHVAPKSVLMTGFVSEGEKWSILTRARAMFYPSAWEGFGLPIIEGFAASTPVVAGRGGAQREVGGSAVLYVDPISVDTLCGRMCELDDGGVRENLVARARTRLRELRDEDRPERLNEALLELL